MDIIAILLGLGLLAALIGTGDEDGGSDGGGEPDPDVTEEGTDGPDALFGANGNDILSGLKGFDDIDAGAGDDRLFGGDGKDLLIGGAGDDIAYGGAWHDGLFGGAGDDLLRGDRGDDLMFGGEGDDLMNGGAGNDLMFGGAGEDLVQGGDGDDLLVGSVVFNRDLTPEEFDQLRDGTIPRDEDGSPIFANYGLNGADEDGAPDILNGEDGDDTMILGNNNIARGGNGSDEFIVGDWIGDGVPAVVNDFTSGSDIIVVAVSDDNADAEIDFQTLGDGSSISITINGSIVAYVNGTFDALDGPGADIISTTYTPVA